MNKVLILDIDGTVRHGKAELGHFVTTPQDVEIFPNVYAILSSYKARGWRIIGISNQGGIALGYTDDRTVARTMFETNRAVGGLFDLILWCPHHPDAKKPEDSTCFCRKPLIGNLVAGLITMANRHQEQYFPTNCLMVGDMEDDRQCAANANVPFMWASEWRDRGPLTDE